jgi:hypothetical protein
MRLGQTRRRTSSASATEMWLPARNTCRKEGNSEPFLACEERGLGMAPELSERMLRAQHAFDIRAFRTTCHEKRCPCRRFLMATTHERVPAHTSGDINRRIQQDIEHSIRFHQRHKSQIAKRLRELNEEWDIERAIEANAAVVSLAGLAAGLLGRSRWFLVPLGAGGFLLQHAIQGWCPPVPVLRRLGFRTSFEIEQERQALKLLRGDYKSVAEGEADIEDVLEAVRQKG